MKLGERDLDIAEAGAALLGLDVATLHADETIEAVRSLLVEARDPWSALMSDLFVGASAGDDERDSRRREDASRRFEAFELGLGLASSRA